MSTEQVDYPALLRQVALLVDGPRTADALGKAADEMERLRRLLTRLRVAALDVVDWAHSQDDAHLPREFRRLADATDDTE